MILFVGERELFDFINEICPEVTYEVGVEQAEAVIIADASEQAAVAAKTAMLINLPVLGILDGCRVLANAVGVPLSDSDSVAEGKQEICVLDSENPIFRGMQSVIKICRGRPDAVQLSALPEGVQSAARGEDGEVLAFRSERGAGFYAVNFYINSDLTPEGRKIIENFTKLKGVTKFEKQYT